MSPNQFCHAKVLRSQSNFSTAFFLLSRDKRKAIEALYAFCREIDDIGDSCTDIPLAKKKLAWWQQEISDMRGIPNHPISTALKPSVERYNLPSEDLEKIIEGVLRDLSHEPFKTWADLDDYSDHVAGAVGRLSVRIFGPVDEDVLSYATHLGQACQYTNILRDIKEDRENSRVYIPSDFLMKYNISLQPNEKNINTPELEMMCKDFYSLTVKKYKNAFDKLPPEHYLSQRPGIVMGGIYRELLEKIRRAKFDVYSKRVSLNSVEKFWAAWKASWGGVPE